MRRKHVFFAAVALCTFAPRAHAEDARGPEASPQVADAAERGVPPARDLLPPEYPSPGAKTTLAIAGSAIFAAWYGAALGASLLWDDAPGAKELRIPVVGPWMSLKDTGCPESDRDCNTTTAVLRAVLTIVDGVGQIGGLAFVGEAIFLPTSGARPRAQTSGSKLPQAGFRTAPQSAFVRGAPFVGNGDALGLSVVGAF